MAFVHRASWDLGVQGRKRERRRLEQEAIDQRVAQNREKDLVSATKKRKQQDAILGVRLDFTARKIQKRTNPVLELQLDWHQQLPGQKALILPMKKDSKQHAEKVDALTAAVQRYLASGMSLPDQSSGFEDTDDEQMDGVEE